MGVDVDPILEVELAIAGGELALPPHVLLEHSGDGGHHSGSGYPLGLAVHGSVGGDRLQSEIDLVPFLGEDVVVEDLANPLEVV